jgi:exo-1,4-beta-D-glucosaminidase
MRGPGARPRWAGVAAVLITVGIALSATPAWAGTRTLGLHGWQVQSQAIATQPGGEISTPGFGTSDWFPVKPDDAGAVGTEVGALVQNGKCPGVFFSTSMKSCFGYMDELGPVTIDRFAVPWWFRTDFSSHLRPDEHANLIVNGVVGKAALWVNGTRVATQRTIQGAFAQHTFDVTGLLRSGANSLALKVHANDPTAMFTLDNVDWNQIPPDNNTGIQFPIQLHTSQQLALSNAHVVEDNSTNLNRAALTVKGYVTNHSRAVQQGIVRATIAPPHHGAAVIHVARTVTVPPETTETVKFTPADAPQLEIRHPQVWWPYRMGGQPLYRLSMCVSQHGRRSDVTSETFGIRTISSHLIGPSPIAPDGVRQFEVNGKPFVYRGGGFVEDLFLRYSSSYTAQEIALIKNLGLNGIRLEGHEMPADFYEQMDRAGILVDAGFQCCDKWQLPEDGQGVTNHDYRVIHRSALTIGKRLRNHPSVMNYSWSDNEPIPRQERVVLRGFSQADFQEPIIASAEYKSTPTLGPSGEKEGPYDWVPPAYWYDTTHFDPDDSSRTNVGGAWAFDSEAGEGHTVPTLDSIKRFMSAGEQAKLWQDPNFNQYHANYEPDLPSPDNGGYSFGTLHSLDTAISHRYGNWSGLRQYVEKAQVQNYETQRAEFEAYIAHSNNRPTPSTGIVYWQLNKGWPTLLWSLFNHDLDQAGSYFGAKKANEPLHVLYTYDTGRVTVGNLTNRSQGGLSVDAKVYDVGGKLLDQQTAHGVALGAEGVAGTGIKPNVPATTTPPTPAKTYFVELELKRHGHVVDRNVYWLSTQRDVVDWPATIGNPQATMSQFANLKQLQGLPTAKLRVAATTCHRRGPVGADTLTKVRITNTSKTPTVAFFLRADVRRGAANGTPDAGDNQVLPIFWNDNDLTLWPGESETLTASYRSSDLRGHSPVVSVSGWNVPTSDVPAH